MRVRFHLFPFYFVYPKLPASCLMRNMLYPLLMPEFSARRHDSRPIAKRYYSPVSNIRDRRMTEKCLHQGWVIGNILQLRIHSALQIFARLQR